MTSLPSIRGVNLLYFITMLFLLTIASTLQLWSPIWGLIATEWLLILPAALIYLRLAHLPAVPTLRLRWPGLRPAALSVLIGVSFSLVALWLAVVLVELFGYSFPVPPALLPRTVGQAVLVFFALTFSAAICEETLFRGVIQRGYERGGPWAGILAGGLLFAIYHLSFQRLIALAPIALVLGYLAWRSSSLVSSILGHFAYNMVAAFLLIAGTFNPALELSLFGSLPLALAGLASGLGGLWLFRRVTPPPPGVTAVAEQGSWLGRTWPLGFAALAFLLLGVSEVILGRFPQLLAREQVALQSPGWQAPARWSYEIRNPLDEPAGSATCSLGQVAGAYRLDCRLDQQAFSVSQGRSTWQTDAYELVQTAQWEADTLRLLSLEASQRGEGFNLAWQVERTATGQRLQVQSGDEQPQTIDLPEQVLVEAEWPWRLSGLAFQVSYLARGNLVHPMKWSPEAQRSLPQVNEGVVVISGAEPVHVPAGNFIAWKVILENQTAWYDVEAPHTLLRYDNGFATYLLVYD